MTIVLLLLLSVVAVTLCSRVVEEREEAAEGPETHYIVESGPRIPKGTEQKRLRRIIKILQRTHIF